MAKKTTVKVAFLALLAVCFTTILLALAEAEPTVQAASRQTTSDQVARGKYLVTIAACHDCHSPKLDEKMTIDETRMLSGRPVTTFPPLQGAGEIRASLDLTAWAGPWGNSYAANLTPDRETGLGGRYTEASFIKTIRTGIKPEGEILAPPMPWNVYRNMTDDDLKAVFAYLSSLKPVHNVVRAAPRIEVARR